MKVNHARCYVKRLVEQYWGLVTPQYEKGSILPVRNMFAGDFQLLSLSEPEENEVFDFAISLSQLSLQEACFRIGEVYTEKLPKQHRAQHGVYFTPPALCNRLLDNIEEAGFDWKYGRVIDPACGGGAFLGPIALRMKNALQAAGHSSESIIRHVRSHLSGIELDPFSAWLSQVFVELALAEEIISSGKPFPVLIHLGDTLVKDDLGQFDLVVGNPPYSKVKLNPEIRKRYSRSLYGHANLYGLFTDKALSLLSNKGILAFVTPTSFLSGQYFKALRQLIVRETNIYGIDFVESRKGVFSNVLQETVLAVFSKARLSSESYSRTIQVNTHSDITVRDNGKFRVQYDSDAPWLIPRSHSDSFLLTKALKNSARLADYGYKVSTGPLVWNRHKDQLQPYQSKTSLPLLWGEAVSKDGVFQHKAQKKNHQPWFRIDGQKDNWLIVEQPCLLLQRTTAKEQTSRLIGSIVPQEFISKYGGVVVENHLNMLKAIDGNQPLISLEALQVILKTDVVDMLFRMMNGSVAVSAYELEALLLPPIEKAIEIQEALLEGNKHETIQNMVRDSYNERITAAA